MCPLPALHHMLDRDTPASRPSRPLSSAEVQVIRSLLAARLVPENVRIGETGLPPRTYHAVRNRVLQEGWVVDRYLPDLGLLGLHHVHFVIGQPFEEKGRDVVERWASDPTNLLLWSGPQTLFGVFVSGPAEWSGPMGLGIGKESGLRRSLALTTDASKFGIPVYLDFEGAWSRMTGSTGHLSYPHPWFARPRDVASSPGSAVPNGISSGALTSIYGLVHRPFEVESEGGNLLRTGPFFAPRSQQRALQRGWVERRLFLDPFRLPPVPGGGMERVALVHGELQRDRPPTGLYHQLLEDCGVAPFLFATDWSHVLLGFVARRTGEGLSAGAPPRASVSFVLQSHLQGIEVFREPLASLRTTVNHRYDRLCPRSPSPPGLAAN